MISDWFASKDVVALVESPPLDPPPQAVINVIRTVPRVLRLAEVNTVNFFIKTLWKDKNTRVHILALIINQAGAGRKRFDVGQC